MNETDDTQLLAELVNLLKDQVAFAKRGDMAEVEQLALQADSFVKEIGGLGVLNMVQHSGLRAEIKRLYEELYMILAVDKAAIARQMERLRLGRRILEAYQKNI